MREILLTRGKVAIVDDRDFEWLNQWKWFALRDNNTWYAGRKIGEPIEGYCGVLVLMHRLIIGAIPGQEVDHADLNGLNNQRSNLRTCTGSQNGANRPAPRNNTSGFKGVSHIPGATGSRGGKLWLAQIRVRGKRIALGYFETKGDAARAYNEAALREFGEFAFLNEIP